ncbi:aldo/keto reductase [Aestuariicella hydrocarbonica]|uniref:Aldo/keto reductase n=1 Tax=Pseudomaricurvus hydrocarbonicus TaxID=1470433 RepID=A0A9E5MKV5_9GAMM|nr:aldo/keto reductase [Aestuariicella hydrocarbonica]NHO65902.1 aldo/keto reductase [Aestuariicella hydrocarbonica]
MSPTLDNPQPIFATSLDHYRLLGRSGLRVSPLSLGTMTFGVEGWGTDYAEAEKIISRYRELGGNFFDTANFYANGDSERMLGKLLQDHRQQSVIATKFSLSMRPGDPNASGNQRKNMVQAVEDSLRRLNTDYIDLLYLHLWDNRTPAEEILRAFDDLVRAGKLLYVGISDTPAWQVARLQAIADLRGWAPLVALQVPYNLTERTVEREFMPMAQEMGLGVLPWSPLAGGVLSGKYRRADLNSKTQDMSSRKNINLATGRLTERALDIADVVCAVAQELNRSAAQIALAWTLLNPAVTSPIIGARTFEQFEDNVAALEVQFTAQQIAGLDAVSEIENCFPHTLIDTPTGEMMQGNVKVEKRHWS